MTRILSAYLAQHGPLSLLAEAAAVVVVFGVIGMMFLVMP